jgi:ribokinase
MFVRLRGEHTLGRNESRAGAILRRRDFCKLHIISHYVARLLCPRGLHVYPIAQVGDDAVGRELRGQMHSSGMDLRFLKTLSGKSTLFSICWLYPDGSGGNITTDDSACAELCPSDVRGAVENLLRDLPGDCSGGSALAAPEVPLDARRELLLLGRRHGWFNVAAFTTAEIRPMLQQGMAGLIDLVSMNEDEAAAMVEMSADAPIERIVQAAGERLARENPAIQLCVTAGGQGAYGWQGGHVEHTPPPKVEVVNTAGAGDATLAGLIIGHGVGLPFILPDRPARKNLSDAPLATSLDLAALLSGLSVECEDTINFATDVETVADLTKRLGADAATILSTLR